ncbi:MAG: porin family protein [Bacteroidetes bacterium]|nr:porin family protein [Bacteroidota bacterium]
MRHSRTKNIIFLLLWNILLITLVLLIQNKSFGQYYHAPTTWSSIMKNWTVNVNGGRTSFFGDVSLYDHEFNEKMKKDGSWAWGVEVGRNMTPVISLSAQYLMGQLAGSNSKSHFVSDIREFTVNGSLDLLNMLIPDNDAGLHPYIKGGMGQFTFDTKLIYNDPDVADVTAESKSPEFIITYGGGVYYLLTNSFDVNVEFMGRRMDNDRIDGTKNSKNNDTYSYLSLGITYKINNVPRDTRYYKRMGMKSPLIRRR